ncbi:hypothetical protein CA54_46730 [Symmachiella macrocystis]|uniref:Uncharacterized protein n=1 Tax=Symmachiella macrocystis TaxID=2527985 RepID=A0A5C6BD43_9PLAN|nr:hypothetical protein [Symmachiella macrocystis]TWU09431.1 hypothetical protein CA54_46730 [Symmachiella macrocystis]
MNVSTVSLRCPMCTVLLNINPEIAAERFNCPKCGKPIRIRQIDPDEDILVSSTDPSDLYLNVDNPLPPQQDAERLSSSSVEPVAEPFSSKRRRRAISPPNHHGLAVIAGAFRVTGVVVWIMTLVGLAMSVSGVFGTLSTESAMGVAFFSMSTLAYTMTCGVAGFCIGLVLVAIGSLIRLIVGMADDVHFLSSTTAQEDEL